MMRRNILPRAASRCGQVLADPRARSGWSGLIPVVAAAAIALWPRPGAAEGPAGTSPPAENGSPDGIGLPPPTAGATEAEATDGSRAAEPPPYWIVEAQRLAASDDGRMLAARLGALLRDGNTAAARQMLGATAATGMAAVETGALASVMLEHVEDPALRTWLQGMPAPSGAAAGEAGTATGADEIRQAVDREKGRADGLQQQLDAARAQLADLETSRARAAELEQALGREKDRTAAVTRDLEAANGRLAEAGDAAARAAASADEATRERSRAEAARQEREEAQRQVDALKGSAAKADELAAMLAQEKERSESLARDRDALQAQVATLGAESAGAAAIRDAAARETQRADAALRQVQALQEQLSALQAADADARDEIGRQKEQGATSARQLEAAQGEIAALKADLSRRGEDDGALRRETAKSAAALRALEAARGPLAAPALRTVKPETVRKAARSRQVVTVRVRTAAVSRSRFRKTYVRLRRGGVWTGLVGGYGNAHRTRTNNGPGIW